MAGIEIQRIGTAFYLGTLFSSVGSMTFTLSALTFMLRNGYTVGDVAILVGSTRFVPLITTALFGDLADRTNPRKLVIATELASIVLTSGILLAWQAGHSYFPLFVFFAVVRASVVGLQIGGRAKISKLLSDSEYHSNATNAIWLNNVTQGATFFAGILGWVAAQNLTFETVILFDAATFLLNGMILWLLPNLNRESSPPGMDRLVDTKPRPHFMNKFLDLYRFAPKEALLDLALAVTMCGFWSFSARTAQSVQISPSFFLISFGAAVWLSGYLERFRFAGMSETFWWAVLSACFSAYWLAAENPFLLLSLAFGKDLAYWVLFHRLSAKIQFKTPSEKTAGVASARAFQMVAALSLGEFAVGLWEHSLTLGGEAFFRASVGFLVLFILLRQSETNLSSTIARNK